MEAFFQLHNIYHHHQNVAAGIPRIYIDVETSIYQYLIFYLFIIIDPSVDSTLHHVWICDTGLSKD